MSDRVFKFRLLIQVLTIADKLSYIRASNTPLHASNQDNFFKATHKMETEVQVPTVPKFSRYRSVRHALRGKETKAAPPLPQSSPQSEDLPQEKPRHRHVHRPVESSAETNVHHHRHQSRRARAPTVDLTRTPQVHSPRRGTEDLEIGVPASPSRATKPTILSQVSVSTE